MPDDPRAPLILHASAVAVSRRGVLIRGASGSGKSTLALQMIGLGATLIADDRTIVTPQAGALHLSAPDSIAGRIEARCAGLLTLPHVTAPAALVVDLDETETERLPEPRETVIEGHPLRLLRRLDSPAFASIVMLHLANGSQT